MSPPARSPRKKMVCIGIDEHHKDFGPLTGAVEDARRWESFFKERLDFEVRLVTHQDLPRSNLAQGLNLLALLDAEVSELGPGDLFGLFLATHGKEIKFKDGQRERLFALPTTSQAVVDDYVGNPQSQRFKTGGPFVTLNQLEEVTARPGLERFFILDACRSVIDLNLPTADRRGERERFAGETIDREMQLRIRQRQLALPSPLTTVNSCSDGQVAKELKHERGGAFTLAGIRVLRKRHASHQPLRFDTPYVADVQGEMRTLADELGAELDDQRPSVIGKGVELWSLSEGVRLQLERLMAEFEAQLAAQAIDAPPGACARDTLSRILVLDIPQADKDELQARLKQAAEEDRRQRDQAHDDALLARARSSDSVDDWSAVRYTARLEAARQQAIDALARLRQQNEDDDAWRTALALRSLAAVERYLAKFGAQARHHDDAQELKARLQREEDTHAESEAWRRAQQDNTVTSYTQFINAWPASLWLSEARRRVRELQTENAARQAEAQAWQALGSTAPLPTTEQGFADKLAAVADFQRRFPHSPRAAAEFEHQLTQGLLRLRDDQEQAAWQAAERAHTIAVYQRHRDVWPEGPHAVEALARIAELQRRADTEAAQAAAAEAQRVAEAALQALQRRSPSTEAQWQQAIADAQAFLQTLPPGSPQRAPAQDLLDAWRHAHQQAVQAQAEAQAWKEIDEQPAPASAAQARARLRQVREHLKTYPDGASAPQARQRAEELEALIETFVERPAEPPVPEQRKPGPPPSPAPSPTAPVHAAPAGSRLKPVAMVVTGVALLGLTVMALLTPQPPQPAASSPVAAPAPAPAPATVAPMVTAQAPAPTPTVPRPDFKRLLGSLGPLPIHSEMADGKRPPSPDAADLAALEAWWSPFMRSGSAAPDATPDELLVVAGALARGTAGAQADAPRAVAHYLRWLGGPAAASAAAERQAVGSIITGLMARKPAAGAAPADWAPVAQALSTAPIASMPGLPIDYWRGAIQYCLLSPADLAGAKASFAAAQRQKSSTDADVADYAEVSRMMLNDYLSKGKSCAQMNAEYATR